MRDISMHVLDIAMNSIKANADLIEITLNEQSKENYIDLIIKDNGVGMSEELVSKTLDPFFTTRTTRKVGLGIPLLKENAKCTGGYLKIHSKVKNGTTINAHFKKSHIDCIPIGDMDETILSLIMLEPKIDFVYNYIKDEFSYQLNTKEIKEVLQNVPISENSVLNWLKEDLNNKFN